MKRGFSLGLMVLFLSFSFRDMAAAAPKGKESNYFNQGKSFYEAARYSEAIDAFEKAIKRHDHAKEAQQMIDQIRKETVERIRNQAITGLNKGNWQTKYFFMTTVEGRIRVGISVQEIFERDSLNFRDGAIEGLTQLADALQKSDNSMVTIELINEIPQDKSITTSEVVPQQLAAVYSFLSLATRKQLLK